MSQQGLPGFWRFVWLFWMQPITLHRLLRGIGVNPEESLWKILRRSRSPQEDWWLLRSAQAMLIFVPGTSVAVAAILSAFGQDVRWGLLAVIMAVFVAGGVVFGTAIGVASGV